MEHFRYSFDSPSFHGITAIEEDQVVGDRSLRSLLANALLIDRQLFPDIWEAVQESCRRLGLDEAPMAFVVNEGGANAFCVPWVNSAGVNYSIGITSGLVRLLTKEELVFVVGHEVGHYLFRHYCYPALGSSDELGRRLAVLSLLRCAEFSADRVGFLAAGSLEVVCSAILKVASGLGAPHLRIHIPAVLDQHRMLANEIGGDATAILASHPMLSLRIRSLIRFSSSQEYCDYVKTGSRGRSLAEIDELIQKDFDKISGFAGVERETSLLEELRLWAVLVLFADDGVLSSEEQKLLVRSFGQEDAEKAINYLRGEGGAAPESVKKRLARACVAAANIPYERLMSVYDEVEKLAGAASSEESSVLRCLKEIAECMGIVRQPVLRRL